MVKLIGPGSGPREVRLTKAPLTVTAEDVAEPVVGVTDEGARKLREAREALDGGGGADRGHGHLPGGRGGPQVPRLWPLVSELFILTKERGVKRIGDVVNYAQMDFVLECERQLASKGQIRICVLKARQIGISTIIEAIAFVMSMLHDDFSSLIVSHEDKSTRKILGMTRRYWNTYVFASYHTEKYASQNQLAWAHGSGIDVATAKNLGAGRSQTIHFLHASEVAFWPEPDVLMTGLRQSVPDFGLNCIFLESTANGVGNYFHKVCNEAMKDENEYAFKFYPWHEHPEYTAAYVPADDIHKYQLDELDEEEMRLRTLFKINDARLIWRRYAIKNKCQNDVNKFHQEYPTTPHEAFVSTGRNVFPLGKLLDHYEPLIGRVGRLIRVNARVRFVDDPGGYLTIFAEPSDDQDWGVYLAGGDPTHTTAGDYACVQVINRRTLEQVAVYRRKIDPINFGKDMQLVGYYFNTAFLSPEKTGPGYATVGCIVGDNYPQVYVTQNVAKMQGAPTDGLYGWLTNMQTKHLAISHLLKALMDGMTRFGSSTYGLLIHDEKTLIEMRDYITTEDGQGYTNSDGSDYDDGVMALAIAIATHNIEPPPPAYETEDARRLPFKAMNVPTSGTGPSIISGTSRVKDNGVMDTRVASKGPAHSGLELMDDPDDVSRWKTLPKPHDAPEDFEDDEPEAPWESWGRTTP